MGIENKTGLQLCSLIKKSGELELSLVKVAIPEPAADEVVVQVEATPINPSDLGLLLGAADLKTAKFLGTSAAQSRTARGELPTMFFRARAASAPGKDSAGAALLWRQAVPSICTIRQNFKAKNAENAICWLNSGRCRDCTYDLSRVKGTLTHQVSLPS